MTPHDPSVEEARQSVIRRAFSYEEPYNSGEASLESDLDALIAAATRAERARFRQAAPVARLREALRPDRDEYDLPADKDGSVQVVVGLDGAYELDLFASDLRAVLALLDTPEGT